MTVFTRLYLHTHMYIVAGNPDLADMLPHLRGQGVLDLEYEADGTCNEVSFSSCPFTHSLMYCREIDLSGNKRV